MIRSFYLLLLVCCAAIGQKTEEITVNSMCSGTLYHPEKPLNDYLVILVAGSGPTDRDGNQPSMKNNSLKMFAEGLSATGTAVFAYDKRPAAQLKAGNTSEKDMSFDDLIYDLREAIVFFRAGYPYKKIIVAGHSEGSTIAIAAAKESADALISIAGPGDSADKIITQQVGQQAPFLVPQVEKNFALLREGKTFKNEMPMLDALFRDSVQPYIISWIKHDPSAEIQKLDMPVLILNGDNDLQVGTDQADKLSKAQPKAREVIIKGMNHVLKEVANEQENMASYSDPEKPLHPQLVPEVNLFLKSL